MKRDKHFDHFAVPYEDGRSVLHALRGEMDYTCVAKLTPNVITVDRLRSVR